MFFDNTQEFSEIYFLVFNLNILFLQKLRIFKRKMRFLCSNQDLVAKFLFTYNIKYLNLLKINVAWQGTFGFYILLHSILYLSKYLGNGFIKKIINGREYTYLSNYYRRSLVLLVTFRWTDISNSRTKRAGLDF